MKKEINYKIDERKALIYLIKKDNPLQRKVDIEWIVDEAFKNNEFDIINIIVTIDTDKKSYTNIFKSNNTGEKYYQHTELPVNIRDIYNTVFNKLYSQFCN